MDKIHIMIGILLFALVTAVLYVWGLRKSAGQREDLDRILLNRCGNKVVKYLKKNGTITEKQVAAQINGVTAGEFWSRKRLVVQQPQKFAKQVIAFLLDQQYIQPAGQDRYQLKK